MSYFWKSYSELSWRSRVKSTLERFQDRILADLFLILMKSQVKHEDSSTAALRISISIYKCIQIGLPFSPPLESEKNRYENVESKDVPTKVKQILLTQK